MAKIRDDFEGITIVRDRAGQDHVLRAGDTVPDGMTVGAHLTGNTKPITTASSSRTIPPKGGPGSSVDAWRDYAASQVAERGLNIDTPADAKKTDIIDALDAVGIPTE